ncbi:serine/threonine protein kinase [Sandaracinus amylolyticus]|uniref:Serine/threonine protein kinase PrkC, regulator of stationary phase n=1 Tax=Sandaracinus amylolyticus TaxID=927083 RepID=A0A0F6YGJ7_9BACT|nr:serine/threonine protein kinase [Sandaracinus amylolyticus]AKF04772.1 Serine/threonine protein kinase PrkC, regulator of stationary phase [Sandaracinus amylolyticus]
MIASEPAAGPEPFGKYLLDREIARGGMARVHLARLRGLGGFEKRLVVKQILPHLALDPRFVSMFVEEAKTLVQMSHPHVVPVYELGVVDGVYFLAMEYVEGATLADVLEEGPLDPAQVAHVGAQTADALSYAHERFSVVHRDVTPRNVMVDAAGHCRLLDFGIAAPAEDDAEGALFGTPGYLAPEQARGETIGPATDLFALGAVLHHALLGEPPVDPHDVDALRARRDPIASVATRGVDPELAAIVDRALALDPKERPPSAAALARALRGWLAARSPEGVAHELGARAERARTRRERRRASERPPAPTTGTSTARREPTGKVRTLAQSRALEEIIAGTAPLPRASVPSGLEPATKPLDRPRPSAAPAPEPVERTERTRLPVAPRARSWVGPVVVGGLAVAGALVLALAAGAPREIDDAPIPDRPVVAAPEPPRVAPPPPPEPDPIATPVTTPAPPETEPATSSTPATEDPARARAASIAVSSRDWAEISVDGRRLGTTPIRRAALAPGAHTIVAENAPLGLRASASFRAEPGTRLRAVVDFRATPPRISVDAQ